jgi:DeoR/GlpR family transcriptional regulator of sugar metabolism
VTFRKSKLIKKYYKGKVSSERQNQVIEFLRQAGKITTQSYAEYFGVSMRTASRDLATLVEKRVLHQVGKARASYFELV